MVQATVDCLIPVRILCSHERTITLTTNISVNVFGYLDWLGPWFTELGRISIALKRDHSMSHNTFKMWAVLKCLPFSLTVAANKNCAPKLASPKYGTATFTNGITHSTVSITCKTGYELVNKTMSSRTCQPTGEWSGDGENFCQPVSCLDQINLPANSTFESGQKPTDPRSGTKIVFACKEGFVKAGGGEQAQCGLNGKWQWPVGKLSCQPLTCTDPRTDLRLDGSTAIGEKKKVFAISSQISFSCKRGFRLVGQTSATCKADGNWSSPAPSCEYSKIQRWYPRIKVELRRVSEDKCFPFFVQLRTKHSHGCDDQHPRAFQCLLITFCVLTANPVAWVAPWDCEVRWGGGGGTIGRGRHRWHEIHSFQDKGEVKSSAKSFYEPVDKTKGLTIARLQKWRSYFGGKLCISVQSQLQSVLARLNNPEQPRKWAAWASFNFWKRWVTDC